MKILISGGGTGGHVFPAIAIGNAIKRLCPDAELLFVGAKGRMEMRRVPEAGYQIVGLWISGLQRRVTFKNLLFPLKLVVSMLQARRIVSTFKPDVVIGVGGYASGPTLKAAASKGIPTAIQEQNSYPGITNRLLAKKVSRVFTAYKGMERFFPAKKILLTGNPIRKDSVNIAGKKDEALKFFNLQQDKKTLLIVGGSQGAWSINEAIERALPQLTERNLQIIWQTGTPFAQRAAQATTKAGTSSIRNIEFIKRMDLAYAAADMIVSRAGAMAISELCVIGKPSILVPYPAAAEDHQTHNAAELSNQGAALLISDSTVRQTLATTILNLLDDIDLQNKLSFNIKKLAITDADEQIATEILKLGTKKPNQDGN
jgi:UDP-N-acetylglucosamine--N-acetylmuramyl-(pentapeptide) pyrophosphoryl-undecaprenol N-acetylglucosamine transferase